MPHIPLRADLPGITGLLAFKPTTGARISALMEEVLRGPGPLSPAERETIATYVSRLNECRFCTRTHGAVIAHLDGGAELREVALGDADATVTPRLSALLKLAGAVVEGGRNVGEAEVAAARSAGATDEEIHDTVLIAAAFCMVNRYVDGLAAHTPDDPGRYEQAGRRLAAAGYLPPAPVDAP